MSAVQTIAVPPHNLEAEKSVLGAVLSPTDAAAVAGRDPGERHRVERVLVQVALGGHVGGVGPVEPDR